MQYFGGIFAFLFISPVFNITEIKVTGAEKINESVYIALSEVQLGENIFKVSKNKIKNLIKTESYVDKVTVKREYPGTLQISVKERKTAYNIENNGVYVYIDKNGYILEVNPEPYQTVILEGITTDLNNSDPGSRLNEEDLSKFNDLIKIIDSLNTDNLKDRVTSINISDSSNYILNLKNDNKIVELGDTKDLSTKASWIEHFLYEEKDSKGTIHLNAQDVYFTPAE